MPGSVAPPLILIGPGTGLTPFIGFIEQRSHMERERARIYNEMHAGVWRGGFELEEADLPSESHQLGQYIESVPSGPIHLFYGCRNDSDYLYKDFLLSAVSEGTLTTLDVAFSRCGPEKVYVTHKLKERGAEIVAMVLLEGAYIYICGDGNSMAKDVFSAIKEILQTHGGLSPREAEDKLQEMRARRRYCLEIWS